MREFQQLHTPALVDTIKVIGEVIPFEHRPGALWTHTDTATGVRTDYPVTRLPGGGEVRLRESGLLQIEVSLPRRVHGDNSRAMPVEQALDELQRLPEMIGLLTQWTDPERLILRRLDLVREFDLDEPAPWVFDGLGKVITPKRVASVHPASSIAWGGRSYRRHSLYDKGMEQHRGRRQRPSSHLRYEVQYGARLLARSGLSLVRDLTPARLSTALHECWTISGYGSRMESGVNLLAAVHRLGLSPQESSGLLYYLQHRAIGLSSGFSVGTERKYSRLAMIHGLPLGPSPLQQTAWLDYESGNLKTDDLQGHGVGVQVGEELGALHPLVRLRNPHSDALEEHL